MTSPDNRTIRAEIRSTEHDARFNEFAILGGLLRKVHAAEAEASIQRETIAAINKDEFVAPPNQEIKVSTTSSEGLVVCARQTGIPEELLGEEVVFWGALQDPASCSDADCLRQGSSGDWRFYGQSIEYDEESQQIWIHNADKTTKVLYREGLEDLSCVMRSVSGSVPDILVQD